MKVITLKQPWATLVAMGVKTVLTYPDPTDYIGPLTICSADRENRVIDSYLARVLASGGYDAHSLPCGSVVAVCSLVVCEKIETTNIPCYPEYAFSEFIEGWYAWKLSDIEAVTI